MYEFLLKMITQDHSKIELICDIKLCSLIKCIKLFVQKKSYY